MRFSKVLGLAAIAAMAAMAFIGTTSASAVDHVVLCKELVPKGKLCPAGKLWPKGSLILALAQNPQLDSTFVTVKCEDSLGTAETTAETGTKLPLKVTSWEFGVLPTPSLGTGCSGCTKGIHPVVPFNSEIEVTGEDEFWLKGTSKATLKGCTGFNFECSYEGTVKAPILHTGSHLLHSGSNLPLIEIETTLTRVAPSSGFCSATGVWLADYVVYLVETPTEKGLGWPALDLPNLL